jgi:glycosyltransferase involved in cell wall biosynthesis
MAARVPVVGSNVSGIKEVISCEETGLLFPSNDDNALTQTLERLMINPDLQANLREKAFTFVRQSCGLRKWVSNYEHLFQPS